MKILRAIVVVVCMLSGMPIVAQQHQQGMIENTTAPMSEKVIRQRLKILGFTEIRIEKTNTLKYQIHALKEGQAVVLDFHPQAGLIRDVTPGKGVAGPWTMPAEPPVKVKIREELPPK
jgi:hypothetical protein